MMKFLSQLVLVVCFSSCSLDRFFGENKPVDHKYSVLQGSTDDHSTVIRVVYEKTLKPTYEILNSQGKVVKIAKRKTFQNAKSPFQSEHLFIDGLKLGMTYSLSIINPLDQSKEIRTFKALSGTGSKLKVLVASCLYDAYFDISEKIWPMAFAHKPDVTFLIGDNIYGDTISPSELTLPTMLSEPNHLWKRHVEHAMSLRLYQMKSLVPTFVTWDDHDYGINDGDKNFKYKEESLKIFKSFFPIYKNDFLTPNLGTGSVLNLRDQKFFFLDGRSFRDGNKEKSGSHLGTKQQDLLFSNLQQSKNLNWLIMGDQFFGAYHPYDSFEGLHNKEFKKFTKKLKELKKRYTFISGDRHLVEIIGLSEQELGSPSLEYTVSGAHTKTYPGSLKRDPNPRRIDGLDGQYNFGIFDLENLNRSKTKIIFKAFTLDGEKISRTDEF